MLLAVILSGIAKAETFTVGIVPQYEAIRSHQIWRPIWAYVEKETGYQFKIEGAPSISDFEIAYGRGDFDIAYMNPYLITIANNKEGYQPIVRDVARKLYGILVVRADSNFNTPADLDGQILAFPAPNSLGASLQMRQELHDIFHINIHPVYVKSHDSVYLNVTLKQAAAGGGVQKTLQSQKDNIKNSLKIIHQTTPVAPHPIAVHPRVPAEAKEAITQALLKLASTDEGIELLKEVPIQKLGRATQEDYQPLEKMDLQRFYQEPDQL